MSTKPIARESFTSHSPEFRFLSAQAHVSLRELAKAKTPQEIERQTMFCLLQGRLINNVIAPIAEGLYGKVIASQFRQLGSELLSVTQPWAQKNLANYQAPEKADLILDRIEAMEQVIGSLLDAQNDVKVHRLQFSTRRAA